MRSPVTMAECPVDPEDGPPHHAGTRHGRRRLHRSAAGQLASRTAHAAPRRMCGHRSGAACRTETSLAGWLVIAPNRNAREATTSGRSPVGPDSGPRYNDYRGLLDQTLLVESAGYQDHCPQEQEGRTTDEEPKTNRDRAGLASEDEPRPLCARPPRSRGSGGRRSQVGAQAMWRCDPAPRSRRGGRR